MKLVIIVLFCCLALAATAPTGKAACEKSGECISGGKLAASLTASKENERDDGGKNSTLVIH